MKLNFFAPVSGWLGYPVHARNFAKALDRNGVDITLFNNEPLTGEGLDEDVVRLIKKQDEADLDAMGVNLSVGGPKWMAQFGGSRRIGYTLLETSRIPDDWVRALNQLDDVWTVSHWGKRVFESCGVKHDVKVVPEGVDTDLFDRERWKGKMKWDPPLDTAYKFLCVGKWEKRKPIEILLRAFLDEFKEPDVHLLVSCHNPFVQGFDPRAAAWEAGIPFDPRIHFLPPGITIYQMAALYASVDAFVLPTRGEGWGLPIIEAMSSGLPVIVPDWGGQSEYLVPETYYKVPSMGLVPVDDSMFFRFTQGSKWNDFDARSFSDRMREVYDHPAAARDMGDRAAKHVRDYWTWDHAAKKAIAILEEYG